jgi:hypothetical protein
MVSLQLSFRNILSSFLHHFQLKMTIVSLPVTILLLVMLQESTMNYGQNEGQVRVIRNSSFSMRLAWQLILVRETKPATTIAVVHMDPVISHCRFHLGLPLAVYQALSTFQAVLMLRPHELTMT